jgi:methylated-DNA-[protein]-cysteine S-methyltransferase
MMYATIINSPVGDLRLVANDTHVIAIDWSIKKQRAYTDARENDAHPVLKHAARELAEYFAGKRTSFTVPVAFTGTPFQNKVWQALARIPFGQTRSYADIARAVGNVNAVRAVGMANSKNPVPIIVPCHRVIGKDGTLTGFAGGLDRKEELLRHEGLMVVS